MDTTPAFPTLRIVSHPLVQHKFTLLRDRATPTKIFKELVDEIAMLMAYEATSELAARAGVRGDAARATTGYAGQRQEAHARADPARRSRHGRGRCSPRPVGARRPHRPVPRSRHARAGGLLLQGAGRRGRARFLSARSDARDGRQRGGGGHLAQARRRHAHSLPLPRRRAGRRAPPRGGAPRRDRLLRRARPRAERAGLHPARTRRRGRPAVRHDGSPPSGIRRITRTTRADNRAAGARRRAPTAAC